METIRIKIFCATAREAMDEIKRLMQVFPWNDFETNISAIPSADGWRLVGSRRRDPISATCQGEQKRSESIPQSPSA